MKTLFVILALISAAAGGAVYYARHMAADPIAGFRMAAIKRGDLLSTISATGTVEPEGVVDVGAQVMGLILEFGPDPHDQAKLIDYGSVVEKGTVLARIDPTTYEAALDQAEATLDKSRADLLQLEAKCEQAESEWKRAAGLLPKNAIAPTDYDIDLANWKTAKASLAPSGMFAMIFTQQFLLFQAPVIMLNWILGPEVVVLFTICRTISSTARQMLQTITYAIAPEVTFSFADRDMKKLLSIYHNSEKVVFSVIPIANLGAFLASPILLAVWLHKPLLFDPYVYGLMALISGAMSMRDHKQFFQLSTNTHKRLSIIVFFGNILMIAASIPFTIKFGIYGFMFTWLVSEVLQMVLIYHENKRLFRNDPSINFLPIVKLWLVLGVSLPICMGLVHFGQRRSLAMVGVAAVVGILMLIVESYFVFGLKDVWTLLQSKLQHNHPVTSQGT